MAVMAVETVGEAATSAESGAAAASTRAGPASKRAASARRKVVLGSTSGPRDQPSPDRPGPPDSGGPRKRSSRKRAFSGARKGYKFATGKENGAALLAEYLIGVFILVFGSISGGSKRGYTTVMSELIVRLTALTAIFFVLFLLAGTKAGKAAMWFGLLVDLGIVFTATTQNVFADLASAVQGKPITDPSTGEALDTATLTASTSVDEPEPAVTLPDSVPGG